MYIPQVTILRCVKRLSVPNEKIKVKREAYEYNIFIIYIMKRITILILCLRGIAFIEAVVIKLDS